MRRSLPGISIAVVVTFAAAASLFVATQAPEANIADIPEASIVDVPEATVVKVSKDPAEKSISAVPSDDSKVHN